MPTYLFIIAFIPILLRISESSITPNATIFNRLWIATAVLGLWNGISLLDRRCSGNSIAVKLLPDNHKFLLLLLMLGVFSGAQQLFYALSLTQTSIANSEVLHSLTPLFTTLVGWKFLGQRFDRRFLMGMAIAIGGSIALVANDFSITIDKLQGEGLALLSAVFWGGISNGCGKATNSVEQQSHSNLGESVVNYFFAANSPDRC